MILPHRHPRISCWEPNWASPLPVGGHPLSVILSSTNLANVAYRDYLNRFRYYADEPGRNVMLKLKLPFSLGKQS